MEIHKIETGNFMLDGGAMFGVVPKAIWKNLYTEIKENLVNLCMRCLLVIDGNRKILIDTGMGDKQSAKFFGYYFPNGNDTLFQSLAKVNVKPEDITDVVITHLHFDHVGGAVITINDKLTPAFPNAQYHISSFQWQSATQPNRLEKASFLKENFIPIQEKNQFSLFDKNFMITDNIEIRLFFGHSKGVAVPVIRYGNKTLVYISDVIPVMAHIPLPYICAYDLEPLVSLQEKDNFLQEALQNNYTLIFEHDLYNECCTLQLTEKGIKPDKIFTLDQFKQC